MQLVLSSHHFLFSINRRRRHHHQNRRNYISFNLQNPNKPPLAATSTTTTTTVSKSAITRIAEKLKTLGFADDAPSPNPNPNPNPTIGEIFVPNSRQIPVHRVGHTLDRSWSSPVNPVPRPGSGNTVVRLNELKEVVKKERREMRKVENERRVPSVAELGLSESERRRLITLGIRMKQKMKLGKAGITEGVVNGIHERWSGCEVVKIVCEDINRINMKRTHDLLERKTGGVVVWRAGSKIILYRGVNYKYPYFSLDEASVDGNSRNPSDLDKELQVEEENPPERHVVTSAEQSSTKVVDRSSVVQGVGSPTRVRFLLPGEKQLVEEADHLLEGLGPRFTDWWGCDPLPIDGDLLPAIVPGYRRPFRLLPYGVKPQLTNDEMTILKRLGRPLPCHFALGRNRNLQGLAAAIVKLWENCEIAKIAIKRGVQNTRSELMAEELKRLTGGILLSRDKEFIVFYRGKDFLPSAVSSAIEERRKSRMQSNKQLKNDSIIITGEDPVQISQGIAYANKSDASKVLEVTRGSEEHKKRSIEAAIKKNTKKLSMALEEKEKAEELLCELEQAELSQQADIDNEGITEEERYMLRRVGLRMKPFLLLGRRGVFDGTVENMHLHWKYRELVKIICNGSDIDEIHRVARILEAESRGILVAVERVRNGHAIIVYRGKNYQRPARLRPQTLLNKKEALKRSIEAQRRQSLKLNVLEISRNIEKLKLKLAEDEGSLDTCEGKQLKMEPEKELDPAVPESSPDFEEGGPCFQQRKVVNVPSLKYESHQKADQHSPSSVCLPTSPDSGLRGKTSSGISHCGDNSEVICSEMNGSSDSGSVQGRISLFHSIGNELEPVTNSISDGNSEHGLLRPAEESSNKQSEPSFNKKAFKDSPTAPARARSLTNKERLLLRKQALTMKKRPVLAVGRSNVVTGIAKAIRDHFRKYPLAIVNVKGRAKGTSVQEVVFQLEQTTGGVLVSQEPSKIILYRGWGGGIEAGFVDKGKKLDKHARVPSGTVSPELIAAMRVECGLELETD